MTMRDPGYEIRDKTWGWVLSRIPHPASRIGPHAALLAALLACAGCYQPFIAEGNYFTYDHPFTEAAAEGIRKNAEGNCRQRGETAVQTSRACSLTQCTTSYQCMSDADARRLAGEKKK